MDEEEYSMSLGEIILNIFILILGIILGGIFSDLFDWGEINDIGQMICDEKGYGEFKSFENFTNTLKCYPKENTERYDGGYIKVVR